MQELKHECGVAALYHLPGAEVSDLVPLLPANKGVRYVKDTSRLIPRMLLDLQNRGQLAAGMSTLQPDREQLLDTFKEIGTVSEAFRLSHPGKAESILAEHCGHAAIGHVRYATCGPNTRRYAQPFERDHGCKWKWFCFAFNGQLANFAELKDELQAANDYHLTRDNDTEVIMHMIARELTGDTMPDLVDVFANLSRRFDGAYNIVYLDAMGRMAVLRDPKGVRPLCVGREGPLFGAASESVALTNLGFAKVRSLQPGEMALVENGELRYARFAPEQPTAHCFFEWIYFANVASTLDDRSVYLSRAALGKELARQELELDQMPLDDGDTIIVPVPDTGKAAADAMAHALGLPSVEGLMRNRYIGRTFIEGANRTDKVHLKYTPLREVMNNKRVLLIEDTIVRSTTLKSLLGHLRERGGAREVHVRVACPPIVAPCFYGIDMSTVGELFAPKFMAGKTPTIAEQQRMADELQADSLVYLPLDAIARCIDLPANRLCRACITGEYPTRTGTEMYQLSLLGPAEKGRTYERNGSPAKPACFEPGKVR